MRLTKQIIRVCSDANFKSTTAYVCRAIPGLAVARACFENDKKGWSLTHIGTGLRCSAIVDKRTAIIALEYLIPAGFDWTLDRDNLVWAYSCRQLRQAIDTAIETARCGRFRQQSLNFV